MYALSSIWIGGSVVEHNQSSAVLSAANSQVMVQGYASTVPSVVGALVVGALVVGALVVGALVVGALVVGARVAMQHTL